MKKLSVILTAALTISLCGITVSAHCGRSVKANKVSLCVCCAEDCSFTDKDSDGVCDLCGNTCSFTDNDGDGICDVCKQSCRYSDCDSDGVCDGCGKESHHAVPVKKSCHKDSGRHGHCR